MSCCVSVTRIGSFDCVKKQNKTWFSVLCYSQVCICISDTTFHPSELSHLRLNLTCACLVSQKLHKISSACGTMKWSATSVCCVCKDDKCVTIVRTFETLINHQTSLNYLSVVIWGIIAVFLLFGIVKCTHTFDSTMAMDRKGIFIRSKKWSTVSVLCLFIVPVDRIKVVCVYQSICQNREMLIQYVVPFQKQYKVQKAIAYCVLVHWCFKYWWQIKSYFLFILAVVHLCFLYIDILALQGIGNKLYKND